MLNIGRPFWMATTRRVVNEPPSRMRSTSYTMGCTDVAGQDEIRVNGMRRAVLRHRLIGRVERLREHLTAEHAPPGGLVVVAPEEVSFYGLELDKVNEFLDGLHKYRSRASCLTHPA